MNREARVLLIEDNPGDVRLIHEVIMQLRPNCCIIVRGDGDDALEYLTERENGVFVNVPDFMILDLNLPRVSGLDFLRHLKNYKELSRIPVVVYTSSDIQTDIDNAYSLGANCYVVKPFSLDHIQEAVTSIWEFWLNTVRLPLISKMA